MRPMMAAMKMIGGMPLEIGTPRSSRRSYMS
jgi:hypothetical protein